MELGSAGGAVARTYSNSSPTFLRVPLGHPVKEEDVPTSLSTGRSTEQGEERSRRPAKGSGSADQASYL